MKKIILASLVVIICAVSAFPVFAAFKNPPITDKAAYLTEDQFDALSRQLEEIRKQYNFDVAIYTENIMSGEETMDTADDIFDYNGYGAGDGADGILLYVSTNPRNYWLTTHGSGESFFNKNGLDYLEKKMLPYLKEDDYNAAFKAYAQYSDELLNMASHGKTFNKKQHDMKYLLFVIGIALFLPPLIAMAFMKRKLAMMNTAVKEDNAANYMKPGSMKLDCSRDIFLYSTVTKEEQKKSDSDSHTSSSGRSHNGQGGSY